MFASKADTAPASKPPNQKSSVEKAPNNKPPTAVEPVLENIVTTTPEELVKKPQEYLGKNIKFTANFFAFSSLALDYKPALRSSKTHLSFLVIRPSTHIPLSELKLAMMVPKEKDPESTLLATLKDGDQLEIVGKVFSTALDEPWVEVFKLVKVGGTSDDKKSVAVGSEKSRTGNSGENRPEKAPEAK
ncbi:MAG: hypothetical protein HY711_07065 [Candidatus Melainabacteria bacterium]|nr:hypothetical protein [Candidatus Melainabacteria bacterium]